MPKQPKRATPIVPYAPINEELFLQALDGAMAGMTGGRAISSSDSSVYAEQTSAAAMWAQAFDIAWNNATAITEVEAQVVLLQSYAVWDGRSATDFTTATAGPPIAAIIASVAAADAVFAMMEISPPTWP